MQELLRVDVRLFGARLGCASLLDPWFGGGRCRRFVARLFRLPVLVARSDLVGVPTDADACLLDVGEDLDSLTRVSNELGGTCELAFRIDDEERLESVLEVLDPEIFVLAAPDADGEDALERVLDLLPDVPAGKLAIAELSGLSREDVAALERAGFDGVIVEPRSVSDLVGDAPPDV